MLTKIENYDLKSLINISSVNRASDTDFYYNNILNKLTYLNINKPFDSEIFEFKPSVSSVNYFIYFLSFKNMDLNPKIVNNIESDFYGYLDRAKFIYDNNLSIGSFDLKQNSNNLSTNVQNDLFKSGIDIAQNKPYLVSDFVGEVNKIRPSKNGLPLFYNTFTFPFSDKIDLWDNQSDKFSNQPFLYNSFLLMELYTTTSTLTQAKIMSVPVFVLNRYMITEYTKNKINQLRPSFFLGNGCDGYSYFFLKSFNIDTFYIKYSFWNSLTGTKSLLIPSSQSSTYKKCVQSASDFDVNNEYLKILFDYSNNSYKLFEYNKLTKNFDIELYSVDLYELHYDDYWAGKVVPNNHPSATQPIINNSTISVSINKESIQYSDTLVKQYFSDNDINNYFSQSYNNDNGILVKEYLKYQSNQIPSLVKSKSFDNNIIFESISSNSYKNLIDTINITNLNSDDITLTDVILTDINITHDSIFNTNSGILSNMVISNTNILFNIYSKNIPKFGSKNNMVYELYSTYSDNGIKNQFNILDFYYSLLNGFYKSPYNQDMANNFSIIEFLDFNVDISNSLVNYFKNNYINSNYGINNYNFNVTGLGSGSGSDLFSDDISGYYMILDKYNDSDPNINKIKFNNLSNDNKFKFLNYIFKYDFNITKKYLSKNIDIYSNNINSNNFTKMSNILSGYDNTNKNINLFNLRDCMIGVVSESPSNGFIIEKNKTLELNIYFVMGLLWGLYCYDIDKPLSLSANIKILLSDINNKKIINIPIKYTIN